MRTSCRIMHRFSSFGILLSLSTYKIEQTTAKEAFVILVSNLYTLKPLNLLIITVSYYSLVAGSN